MEKKISSEKKTSKDKKKISFFKINHLIKTTDESLWNETENKGANLILNNEKLDHILKDRIMKDVSYPAINKLTITEVFDQNDKPRIQILENHFINEGRLTEETAKKIITSAKLLLHNEPNLLYVKPPVTIVGDIHGQYYDLLTAINHGGVPGETKYLFLGDYVDRGHFSMEVLLYLYSLKILYPDSIFLLRGNHECRHLTEYFTFKKECLIKYSQNIYNECTSSFDALSLAAIVNNQFLCVHGGISPEFISVEDIKLINRFRETPQKGKMCDLLWSDPHPDYENENAKANEPIKGNKLNKSNRVLEMRHGYGSESTKGNSSFQNNLTRGCSYYYNFHAVSEFLSKNNLLSVIRAHEAQDTGFRTYKNTEANKFPSLMTIFSAPNYLDVYNNRGAIIVIAGDNILNVRQFGSKPHPYWLPNFMDVFTWSLPFIGEKIMEMLYVILNQIGDADESFERRTIVRQKILAISHLAHLYKKIRSENEAIVKLNGIAVPEKSPLASLVTHKAERRKSSLDEMNRLLGDNFVENRRRLSFHEAKELDKENEQLPQNFKIKNTL